MSVFKGFMGERIERLEAGNADLRAALKSTQAELRRSQASLGGAIEYLQVLLDEVTAERDALRDQLKAQAS